MISVGEYGGGVFEQSSKHGRRGSGMTSEARCVSKLLTPMQRRDDAYLHGAFYPRLL